MREYIGPFKKRIYEPGIDVEAHKDSMLYRLIHNRSKMDFAKNRGAEWADAFRDIASQHSDSPYGQIHHVVEFMRKRLKKEWEDYAEQFEPEIIPHAQLLGAAQTAKYGATEYTAVHDKLHTGTLVLQEAFKQIIDIEVFYGNRTGAFGPELGSVGKFVTFVDDFKAQKDECTAKFELDVKPLHADVKSLTEQIKTVQAKLADEWRLKRLVNFEVQVARTKHEINTVLKTMRQFARYRRQEAKEGDGNIFVEMDKIKERKAQRDNVTEQLHNAQLTYSKDMKNRNGWDETHTLETLLDEFEKEWKETGLMYKSERDHGHEMTYYLAIVEQALADYESTINEDPPTGSQELTKIGIEIYQNSSSILDMADEAKSYVSVNDDGQAIEKMKSFTKKYDKVTGEMGFSLKLTSQQALDLTWIK